MKNKQFIVLLIMLGIIVALTTVVMKFHSPTAVEESEDPMTARQKVELQSLIGQAYFLMSNGDYTYAENILSRLFEISPNDILGLQMSGQIYFNTGRYKEAENVFRKLILQLPENGSNYNNLAQILAQQKDYKNAIIYLKKALELDPDVLLLHFNLAELYLLADDKESAVEQLRIAFEMAKKQRILVLNLSAFKSLESEKSYRQLVSDYVASQLTFADDSVGGENEQN